MRKIAIAAAVSFSLSGVTNVSHALGLGEIEMYSALNQNLDAEIAILSATEAELRNIQVKLASASAFARAGLEVSPVLSSVEFAVDQRPDGKAVVKVTSDGPVLEPFLNFLLEVDAPGSVKLVREYTVLLNPPTFAASQTSDQVPVTSSSADVFANTSNNGTGVQIDLADAIPSTFEGNDTGSEVIFTESTVGTFTADADGDNLFVPDDQILSGSVVDSNGQVISLTQELNTEPQFDNSAIVGGEAIDLADNSQAMSLDNLGSSEPDNAIFGNEFAGGELISGEELRGLVGDAAIAEPVVEFEESTADLFVNDLSVTDLSSDTDAQGNAGDLIDLSGVMDDSGSFLQEVVTSSGNRVSQDGVIVQIDETAQSGVSSAARSSSVSVSGETYRIRSQDTLWSIANARKARGVSPHQMMVALLDANPAAFLGGNMNRMRSGAVLQIPTESAQRSIDAGNAFATVQSWTRDNRPLANTGSVSNIIQPATVSEESEIVINDTNTTYSTDLNSNLDDVTQRYEEVQTEIVTGTFERDALQGRVDNLTDNMEEMKSLITVREDELNQLQDEVLAAESNAAAIDAQISQLSNASDSVAAVQQGLNQELTEAQSAIARQADVDKNMATAEAEAASVRLSSEEDALRAQLVALEIEKRDLEETSQLEKADLVRQAEAEKTRMLALAKSEKENIQAELEAEKARISRDAEMEIARIKGEADVENQRLLNEAQADSEQMQAQLQEMEAEKNRLLEEAQNGTAQLETESPVMASMDGNSDEPSRVKDRLAQLQEEGGEQAAEIQTNVTAAVDTDTDTDAEGMVEGAKDTVGGITDAGKSMVAGGAAAVGGLVGFKPLQEMVGNRKTVLAAGAGLSLLGLLGAWGLRRRKAKPAEVKGIRPRGEVRPVAAPNARPNYDREEAMYGDADENYVKPQRRSSSSAAAAAAAAAAAVTGTAAVATSRNDNKPADDQKSLVTKNAESTQDSATTTQAPPAATAPVPEATVSTEKSASPAEPTAPDTTAEDAASKADAELEEKALDDTITEAEVYLRYGLHGQAEDLLKTAIDRSPNNEEYQFKLLENYHDQKNSDDFNAMAEKFKGKFPNSGHMSRIAEMGAEIDGGGSSSGIVGGLAAGAAAMATGAAVSAKDSASDGFDFLTDDSADDQQSNLLDQTIDPGTEFSVDELQATGNLGAFTSDEASFSDQGGMSLDDVDLASLDDDGTMNLEEIAGSQMSGGDLGTLDLTNQDIDTSFDNLSLDDVDLNSVGNVGDISHGLDGDLPIGAQIAGQIGGQVGGQGAGQIAGHITGETDEMETMLDLAKAYMDMGDNSSATKALEDIAARGNPLQQTEAAELLNKLSK